MAKYFRPPWVLGSYLILGIVVLRGALTLGFFCDDALWLVNSQGGWFHVDKGLYQYLGFEYALSGIIYKAFQLNALPYHAFLLGLVIVNAFLVYLLARRLGLEPWQAWVAGLLALFNSVASEAYFWFTCLNSVSMTTCTLTALIFLSRWRQGGSFSWGLGYLFMIVLTPMVESKGVILPWLGLFLDLYLLGTPVGTPKRPFLCGWRFQILAISLGGLTVLMRHLLGIKHYVINLPLEVKLFTFRETLLSTFYRGLDDHLWPFLFNSPLTFAMVKWLLLLVFLALILLALAKMVGPERRLFFTLLLLWGGVCLPHVLAANWQYCYFYFPGVFSALVLAALLGFLRRRYAGKPGIVLVSLVILSFLYLDLKAFRLAYASFTEANQIYAAGIRQIRERLPQLPPHAQLILIDFPDYIYSRQEQGPPKPGHLYYVYVYRNALPSHLRLIYGTDQFTVTHLKLTSPPYSLAVPLGEPVSREQLPGLLTSPLTYAFRFLPGNPPRFISLEN